MQTFFFIDKQTLICRTTEYSGADEKNKEVIKKYFCLLFQLLMFLRVTSYTYICIRCLGEFKLVQMILKTLCALVALVLELFQRYGDGEFEWYYG